MEKYNGEIASRGIVQGELFWYQNEKIEASIKKNINVEEELLKYKKAFNILEEDLEKLHKKAMETFDDKTADVFSAYLMILLDEILQKKIENKIRLDKINAEYAIQTVCQEFADGFFLLEDAYMKERGNDILHVSHRLLEAFKDEQAEVKQLDFPVILVANDLTPSELFQLNYEMIIGIVLLKGSIYSHTTVLVEMMNIPMLVNVKRLIGEKTHKQDGIINANQGVFFLYPDQSTVEETKILIEKSLQKNDYLKKYIGKKTCTLDGKKINLFANIGCLADLEQAIDNDAEGIGLLRSEGLFMQEKKEPSEEKQFKFYKEIVEKMQGKKVIIRTIDVGADKKISYLHMHKEENPAIGMRGIRYALLHPEILKTQLRAILRAAAYGPVGILYPMITSVEEVISVKKQLEEVKIELLKNNVNFGEVEQGIMIETPAAALCSDVLAKVVDFFSLGTNDLTQNTLAMDRQNPQLNKLFNGKHPAVLKLIRLSIKNAHEGGIPIEICGELGGDFSFVEQLLEMKLDTLSVVPSKILELREIVGKLDLSK